MSPIKVNVSYPYLTLNTGWERTGQMLCIVDTSLSVLMTLRMCLRELCCVFYCLDLNHLVRVFYLCFHNGYLWRRLDVAF